MTTTKAERRQAWDRLQEFLAVLKARPELLDPTPPTAAEKERQEAVSTIREALRGLTAIAQLLHGYVALHREMGPNEAFGECEEHLVVTVSFLEDVAVGVGTHHMNLDELLPLLVPELAGEKT
jgi:hypothetical protein